MTIEQAIGLMKSSTSVEQWNENRHKVQNKVSQSQWEQLRSQIDAYGLIVQVLGKDDPKQKYQTK